MRWILSHRVPWVELTTVSRRSLTFVEPVSIAVENELVIGAKEKSLLEQIEQDALDDGVPVSTVLRKCIALGGKSGSVELRDWATRELKGYSIDDDLPEYRVVPAPILIDAFVGNGQVTGQPISAGAIPERFREHMGDSARLRQGLGELEALLGQKKIMLMPSVAPMIAAAMNEAIGEYSQQITHVYWKISPSVVRGVLDQVRTSLVQLVAEMRSEMSDADALPSRKAADEAVNVVVTGRRATVNVASSTSSGPGSTAVSSVETNAGEPGHSAWTRSRMIGGLIVGVATVVAAVVALLQYA